MDERLVDWIANEGIRISSIVRHLSLEAGGHPLVRGILDVGANEPAFEAAAAARPDRSHGPYVEQDGARVSLVVPFRVPLDVVTVGGPAAPSPHAPPEKSRDRAFRDDRPPDSLPMEAVKIDQKTLGTRPGYKATFLGTGPLAVPMPTLPAGL